MTLLTLMNELEKLRREVERLRVDVDVLKKKPTGLATGPKKNAKSK